MLTHSLHNSVSQIRNLPKATIHNQQYGNNKSGQPRGIHNRKCPVKKYTLKDQISARFNSLTVLPNIDCISFGI